MHFRSIPRTLLLITSQNPANQNLGSERQDQRDLLLLKGAPTKRLWANKYNGLGGHIEADEDIHAAAVREVSEETGLSLQLLTLRGIVNINTGSDESGPRPGVLIFVLLGESNQREVQASCEGTPEWIPVVEIANYPLVDDLYEVLPRTLGEGPCFFGHYNPGPDGAMRYTFQ